jgi:hypothetical protein
VLLLKDEKTLEGEKRFVQQNNQKSLLLPIRESERCPAFEYLKQSEIRKRKKGRKTGTQVNEKFI